MASHSSTLAWKIPWTGEPSTAVHGVVIIQDSFLTPLKVHSSLASDSGRELVWFVRGWKPRTHWGSPGPSMNGRVCGCPSSCPFSQVYGCAVYPPNISLKKQLGGALAPWAPEIRISLRNRFYQRLSPAPAGCGGVKCF